MPIKFAGARTAWRFRRIVERMKPKTKTSDWPAPATKQCRPEETLLSIGQTAQLSGVSEADLRGLIEYGGLAPSEPETEPRWFGSENCCSLALARVCKRDIDPGYRKSPGQFDALQTSARR